MLRDSTYRERGSDVGYAEWYWNSGTQEAAGLMQETCLWAVLRAGRKLEMQWASLERAGKSSAMLVEAQQIGSSADEERRQRRKRNEVQQVQGTQREGTGKEKQQVGLVLTETETTVHTRYRRAPTANKQLPATASSSRFTPSTHIQDSRPGMEIRRAGKGV